MGDALHYIDFHQLQIENKQYVSRIEERNDELLKVILQRSNAFMRGSKIDPVDKYFTTDTKLHDCTAKVHSMYFRRTQQQTL